MKFFLRLLTVSVFFFYINNGKAQTIIYVDAAASGLNNGSSWANAYTSLDAAFLKETAITNKDTIKVAQGIYRPSSMPFGLVSNDPRDAAFLMPLHGNILGGYASNGMRDTKKFPTILSGDIGVPNDSTDNSYHVLLFVNSKATLNGFTIEKGNASGNGNFQIDTIGIKKSEGGAIYSYRSFLNFSEIVFKDNMAGSGGACSINVSSESYFTNCFYLNNEASKDGGAVKIASLSSASFINAVFYRNSAFQNGGAIINTSDSTYLSLEHCTFVSNGSFNMGGAIYTQGLVTSITNTVFTLNFIFTPDNTWSQGVDIEDSLTHAEVSNSLLQAFDGGSNCIQTGQAYLFNVNDPYGADKIAGTSDDGLRITPSSAAFMAGNSYINNFDIVGNLRYSNGCDLGAYETGACSLIKNRTAYVDSSAKGNKTGVSWSDGFTELQSAVNLALHGCVDTIRVAKGTYMPLNPPKGFEVKMASANYNTFYLPGNVSLLGGYPSGGGSRNPSQNQCRLMASANGAGSGHVVMIADQTNVLIDGFSIENGYARGGLYDSTDIDGKKYPEGDGGGILVYNSTVTLKNCTVKNNFASNFGGGVRVHNSRINTYNCSISNNQAKDGEALAQGGGMVITWTQPGSTITKTTFENNIAWYDGGAMALSNCYNTVMLDSCTFRENYTLVNAGNFDGGGAIFSDKGTYLLIDHSLFDSNKSWCGGALNLHDNTSNTIMRSVFTNNAAGRDGGALFNTIALYTNVSNCIFLNNKADQKGGAVANQSFDAKFYFCNFFQNSSTNGGGVYNSHSIQIDNSIFWRNSVGGNATTPGSDISNTGSLKPYNSLFQIGTVVDPAYGNVKGIDPLFVDTANFIGSDGIWGTKDDGAALKLESPLLNRQQYYAMPDWPQTDMAGRPRISCLWPDMGSYETDECNFPGFINGTVYVDSSAVNGKNNGADWQNAFTSIDKAIAVIDSFKVDTIKIAKGSYSPSTSDGFNLPPDIVVMGGYPGGGGERNFNSNSTVLLNNFSGPVVSISNKNRVVLDGLVLENAQTVFIGGGCLHAEKTDLLVKNVKFRNCNSGPGSAVHVSECTGSFVNCIIADNYADGGAPAGVFNWISSMKYINCVFSNNVSHGGAGAITTYASVPSLINCTFYNNVDLYGTAGAIVAPDSTPIIRNCIFWGNRNVNVNTNSYRNEMEQSRNFIPSNISNSLFEFQTQQPVSNCIHELYPNFKDTLNVAGPDGVFGTKDDGLALNDFSVAVNKGNNSFLPVEVLTDIAGERRIAADTVDMGAYETTSLTSSSCIVIQPDFQFEKDSINNFTVKFTDLTPNNHSYYNNVIKWYFGDGDSSSSLTPVHTYAGSGSYSVKMTYTNPLGCFKDTVKTIVIAPKECKLNVSFSYTGNKIAPANVNFINATQPDSAVSYKWYFGTGDSSSLKNPTYIFTSSGTFTIKLMVSAGSGCIASHDTTIIIDQQPPCQTEAGFTYNGATIAPATISFQNTSINADSYQWSFGDGVISNATDTVHIYSSAGVYSVKLIANAVAGCSDTLVKNITILPKQDSCTITPGFIYFMDSLTVYAANFVNISTPTSGVKMHWDFGDRVFSQEVNPVHDFKMPGVYKVCLTVTKDSICKKMFCDTVSVANSSITPITIYPNPVGSTLTVSFDLAIADDIDLLIYNDAGNLVKQVRKYGISGMNMFQIDVSDLQKGLYVLQVNSSKNLGYSIKFMKF